MASSMVSEARQPSTSVPVNIGEGTHGVAWSRRGLAHGDWPAVDLLEGLHELPHSDAVTRAPR